MVSHFSMYTVLPFTEEMVSSPASDIFSCLSEISLLCVHKASEFSVVTGTRVSSFVL